MKKTLLLLAIAALSFTACSNKKDEDADKSIRMVGAWTMSTQTQKGKTLPASKPKSISDFGKNTEKTIQLDIKDVSLKFIETDSVQVYVTDYAWVVKGQEIVLTNLTSPNAPIEIIPFQVTDNALVLTTPAYGEMTFTKISNQSLAISSAKAVNVDQLVDLHFLISIGGGTTPLDVPTKGVLDKIQTPTSAVTMSCQYDYGKKMATLEYSNINDSPDSKIKMNFSLDFNLVSPSENSLFTSTADMTASIYGKSITASGATCAGSMARTEFYVKFDMRCVGLALDGSLGSNVDMSGKIQCLF